MPGDQYQMSMEKMKKITLITSFSFTIYRSPEYIGLLKNFLSNSHIHALQMPSISLLIFTLIDAAIADGFPPPTTEDGVFPSDFLFGSLKMFTHDMNWRSRDI